MNAYELIKLALKEKLKGGLADGKPDSAFDHKALKAGTKVELEHTKDKGAAKEVAKDHLTEHPTYYRMLKRMEQRLEKQ